MTLVVAVVMLRNDKAVGWNACHDDDADADVEGKRRRTQNIFADAIDDVPM